MNHREPPHLPAGVRRALHCLSLLLLPALAPDGVHALPRPRPAGAGGSHGAGPYLPVAGAPPLRFQEPAPPPDLVTRPPAAAPPTPALTPAESSVALANAAAARSASVSESEPEPASPEAPPPAQAEAPPAADDASTEPDASAAPTPKSPPPILRDDARPTVRPEDFLPFFQLPGSAQQPSDVTVVVPATPAAAPAPGTLPPSSATYTQSPR